MALCSLFVHLHDDTQDKLHRRLLRLSREGNRDYGLLRLHLGQPITDIIEAEDFVTRNVTSVLRRWTESGQSKTDMNGSNAPLVRLHPVAACKQPLLTRSRLQAPASRLGRDEPEFL